MEEIIQKIMANLKHVRFDDRTGEDLYLSDGKIVFKLPNCAKLLPESLEIRIPDGAAAKMLAESKKTGDGLLVEKVLALTEPPTKCSNCNGSGYAFLCRKCKGAGQIECSCCGVESYCKECGGIGAASHGGEKDDCPLCNGYRHKIQPVKLFDRHIDARYLRLIAEIAPMSTIFPTKAPQPFYFENDHTRGLVMNCLV